MKTTIFAAVAVLGLTVGGAVMAERAPVAQVQVAAGGGGSHPDAQTNEHGTQYAAGGGSHPQAETNERATQLAASGIDSVRQSHGDYA